MCSMQSTRVLIINDVYRPGLAIARGLKMEDDYEVHVVAPSQGSVDTIRDKLRSKSVDSTRFVKDLFSDASFVEELVGTVTKLGIDIMIPAGQRAAMWVSRAKSELSRFCHVLVENYDKMLKFHDKAQTVLLARDLNIPVPLTFFLESVKDIESHTDSLAYPVVIKGRKGTGNSGVWYAKDAEELVRISGKLSERKTAGDGFAYDNTNPMLQEFIPGEVHDAVAFFVKGEMKAGLTQKRIITRPTTGGPGVVSVTTRHPELLNYANRIMKSVKWNGVCQVEFKIDERDGQPKLLEVNPRFWGTTWLAVCAGFNYPQYLVRQALGKTLDLPQDYEVNLMGRWPLMELSTVFEKPLSLSSLLQRTIGFVSRFRYEKCVYDVLPSDINPCVDEIVNGFYRLYNTLVRRQN